ncbi:MAG: hypothetical protein K2Y37_01620 [Pirellulales bacterium]|nr:hypothetical protein [Pirellulales bacterium]
MSISSPLRSQRGLDLTHNLLLPTLLFAALGAMSWAVRGCAGFGGSAGCIFAGVLWGVAWWFVARDGTSAQDEGDEWAWPARRYTSGWIVLALTIGIGISGARGWMQWPSFFEGKLQTDYAKGQFVPISRAYGFLWLFIAGIPWAGIGACLLAWCSPLRTTRAWHWALRIGCGLGAAALAVYLYQRYPQHFLPLYEEHRDRYLDLDNNPNLRRLINDSRSAIMHLGLFLGFLIYEVVRRDWKNVLLITTVGVLNGAGWAALQNWKWHDDIWPGVTFNWWRCWESSGGISIGIAYGVAYFLVNRPMRAAERAMIRARRSLSSPSIEWLVVYLGLIALLVLPVWEEAHVSIQAFLAVVALFGIVYCLRTRRHSSQLEPVSKPGLGATAGLPSSAKFDTALLDELAVAPDAGSMRVLKLLLGTASPRANGDPNLERFGLGLGLLVGLGFSVRNGLKGFFRMHYGNEEYYATLLWQIVGPALVVILLGLCAWIFWRPLPGNFTGDAFPRAAAITWLALVWQNVLGQLVTGPLSEWPEFAFAAYYVLLFVITAVIVIHFSDRVRCLPMGR